MATYSCESWTIKEAGHQRTDAFELWYWKDSWKSLGQQGDQTSQSWKRSTTMNIHWKDWCWSWSSSILVIWCEQVTHWKSPWGWERLRAEVEEGVRGWDGWTASPIQWTWTWANSGYGEKQRGLKRCNPWVERSWTWLCDWTAIITVILPSILTSQILIRHLRMCLNNSS